MLWWIYLIFLIHKMVRPYTTACYGAVTVHVYDSELKLEVPRSAPVIIKPIKKYVTFSTANSFLNEVLPERCIEIDTISNVEDCLFDRSFIVKLSADYSTTVKLGRNNIILNIGRGVYGIGLSVPIAYDDFNDNVYQMLINTHKYVERSNIYKGLHRPEYRYSNDNMLIEYSYFIETQLLTAIALHPTGDHPLVGTMIGKILLIRECSINELDHFTVILCDITNRFSVDEHGNVYFDGTPTGNTVRGADALMSIRYEIKRRFMSEITTRTKNARS